MADRRTSTVLQQAARLFRRGELAEAEDLCHRLLKRNPRDVNALQLLGTISLQRGALSDSLRHYRACVSLQPREGHHHYLVGKACAVLGQLDEAGRHFDAALKRRPGYLHAIRWKAATLERQGEIDAARQVLAPFADEAAADPDLADVRARLAVHDDDAEQVVEICRAQLERGDLEPRHRQVFSFHLGRACDKLGRYDEAFDAFVTANSIDARPFDAETHRQLVDRLIETFTRENIGRVPHGSDRSRLPVIIAGMPRSGTTLVEQIIDAHPDAAGVGEITDIEGLAAGLTGRLGSTQPFPQCAIEITRSSVDELSGPYLTELARLAPFAARVVNKSLLNYQMLGLVAMLWPGAQIVHCRRHPLDTCLSCFMSQILPGKHPYVTDLRSLGVAYGQYERLMSHWADALDLPTLDVSYEDLVAEPEPCIRRIIDFLGLPFDDRCLEPHRSGRTVMTLSYDQVRRPVYTSAVARYRSYEHRLGPLIESLEGERARV